MDDLHILNKREKNHRRKYLFVAHIIHEAALATNVLWKPRIHPYIADQFDILKSIQAAGARKVVEFT